MAAEGALAGDGAGWLGVGPQANRQHTYTHGSNMNRFTSPPSRRGDVAAAREPRQPSAQQARQGAAGPPGTGWVSAV
jgi:hypothetical protein